MFVFATLIAVSVPAIILGKAMVGSPVILALLMVFALPERAKILAMARQTLATNTAKLIYVTAVIWLVGLTITSDLTKSLQTEFRTLLFIAGTTVIWAALSVRRAAIDIFMKALMASVIILGTISVISLTSPYELIIYIRGYEKSGLHSIILLKAAASSSALLIPVLIWIGARFRGVWTVFAAVAIAELAAIIFLTNSRSALAGVLASVMVVGMAIISSQRKANVRLMWILAMLGCLVVTIIWLFVTRSWTVTATDSSVWWLPVWLIDAARQGIWAYAWNASEEWRWFGVGINVVDSLPGAAEHNALTNTANIPLHPHNWMVEIIVETGVVGFIAMITTIGHRFLSFLRRYVRHKEPALLTLMAVWAAYWGSGLFNFSYWSAWWQESFLLLTAVCLAGRENLAPKDQ